MVHLIAYSRGHQHTLPFQRRVRLPLGILAQQMVFSSFRVQECAPQCIAGGMLLGPELLLFQNWVPCDLMEAEVFLSSAYRTQQTGTLRSWIYDLEDPQLLEDPLVQMILPTMRLVTVPNNHLKRQVRVLLHQGQQPIQVLPSTLSFQWLHGSCAHDTAIITIGCFGNHDFFPSFFPTFLSSLRETLATLPEPWAYPLFMGDSQIAIACHEQKFSCVLTAALDSITYPTYLTRCDLGLCPRDGQDGRDCAPGYEYATVGAPIFASIESSYQEEEKLSSCATFLPHDPVVWGQKLAQFLCYPVQCTSWLQQQVHCLRVATQVRAERVARRYAQVYSQILPGLTPLH